MYNFLSLRRVVLATTALAFVTAACTDHKLVSLPDFPAIVDAVNPGTFLPTSLTTVGNVQVFNGGFGSAIAADPNDPGAFFMLADRGPNIDGTIANSKVFALPAYAPQIGKFRVKNGQMLLEKVIELRNSAGGKLNGLPNPVGQGSTGEVALGLSGNNLGTSIDGIDSEGLVALPDGTFWVSDEYGPHIVHFDATGKTIERINPFGSAVPAGAKFRAYSLRADQTGAWKA